MATPNEFLVGLVESDNVLVVGATDTVSSSINTFGTTALALFFPSNFTNCDITFEVSNDNANFYTLAVGNTGLPLAYIANADTAINLAITLLAYRFFRIVCSVAQATESRVIVSAAPIVNREFN